MPTQSRLAEKAPSLSDVLTESATAETNSRGERSWVTLVRQQQIRNLACFDKDSIGWVWQGTLSISEPEQGGRPSYHAIPRSTQRAVGGRDGNHSGEAKTKIYIKSAPRWRRAISKTSLSLIHRHTTGILNRKKIWKFFCRVCEVH